MIFFKKNNNENEPKRVVAVLGTSPLALFLISVLQQNNVEVIALDSLKKYESKKTETWLLRSNLKNQSFSFKFSHEVKKRPEYVFLASSFDEYKNDLLALSDEMLKEVPLVNFASFYNQKLIEQAENFDEIRAYFKGWLIKDNKEIAMLDKSTEIKICCSDKIAEDLQNILADKKIDIKVAKNSKKMFWQKMMAWFAGNLFVLVYEKDISKALLDTKIRKDADDVIKEICRILKDNQIEINAQTLLTDIYAFPNGFVSEYNSGRGVLSLSEMIGSINYYSHPKLFDLMKKAFKKY